MHFPVTQGSPRYPVTKELLDAFQAHPGIEQLERERVAKAMHGVALLFESGLLDIFYEAAPSGTVTEALILPWP